LLLQISCRVLGVGGADAGADDRTGSRPDARATTAADRGTDRRPETGAKNGAADGLGIGLVAQRGNLGVGKLPACLIIIVRLRQSSGTHRKRRQNRADKPRGD
jgi:hypothetical protein